MTTSGVQLFQSIKSRVGERESRALIDFVEDKINDNNETMYTRMVDTFVTKAEFRAEAGFVRSEFARVWVEFAKFREEIAIFRGEFAREVGRLETKIAEVKSDVIRWMFAFFVTMLLAILGLYLKK